MPIRKSFISRDHLRDDDRLILIHESRLLVRGDEFVWQASELTHCLGPDEDLLKIEDGEDYVLAVCVREDLTQRLEAESRSLRSLLYSHRDRDFAVAGKAKQIVDWYNSHRYCGACGSPTVPHASERAVRCPACDLQFFPRINPCVIVLVTRGQEMLLARSTRFKTGFFSCLAGFIEVGESAEETVHREVMEESGIAVENVRYLKSQSWPFPSQLMLGFLADYRSGEIVPEPEEIAEAGWFGIDNLPDIPPPGISVAGELIQHFIAQVRAGAL